MLWTCLLVVLASCQKIDVPAPQTIDLNGAWAFRQVGHTTWTKANVPGVVQLDMLTAGLIEDPFYGLNEHEIGWIELEDWEYERIFEVDATFLTQEVVELVFEGLDTYAEVLLNGQVLVTTDNMFKTWRVDCKKYLKEGKNKLTVIFKSPIKTKEQAYNDLGYQLPAGNDAGQIKVSPFVRKAPYHFGWDWGPRIVTMGIWRPVYLEANNVFKVKDVYFNQQTVTKEKAVVNTQITVDYFAEEPKNVIVGIYHQDKLLQELKTKTKKGQQIHQVNFEIENPTLWWCNGLGEPHLYPFQVKVKVEDCIAYRKTYTIGLRSIELVQEEDSIGTSYYFKLNGKPVFMKGANYIPQDNLLPRVTEQQYQQTIQNAVDANMNMLRVWGGGVYESDYFYELCDEKGLLVWQDFMFACGMYPSDAAFLENVQEEVSQNIRRLRNHACLALWCGNNEMEVAWNNWGWQQQFGYSQEDSTTIIEGYKKLFHQIIPETLDKLDVQQAYVVTSPLSNWGTPANFNHHSMHYWGVWHGREPFENYATNVGRFMSEYGFQSFPEMKTIESFAAENQWDLESNVMKHHQKSYIGNGMILKHLETYYPQPTTFENFVYLSQLTQAYGLKIAIENHRKTRHCMGTLYWQLNDCWTGPSWSSVDYWGNWKALHYRVRDWYKPVSLIVENATDDTISITAVSDLLQSVEGVLDLKLIDLNGQELWKTQKDITLGEQAIKLVYTKNIAAILAQSDRQKVVLQAALSTNNGELETLHYFVSPKNLVLEKAILQKELNPVKDGYNLTISAPTLVKNLMIAVPIQGVHLSNNYMDLLPNQKVTIHIQTKEQLSLDQINLMSINDLVVEE